MWEFIIKMTNWIGKNFLEILRSLSVIIASIAALKGINACRRELKGKKKLN